MTKSSTIKCALLLVSACLGLAWLGATEAAERERATALDTTPLDDELRLIKSDAESVIVELSTSSFEVYESTIDGRVYHLVTAPGCGQTEDVGKPQLPVRGTLLGIPPEAEYSLRVIEVEQEPLPGQYDIYPVPEPVLERDAEGNPLQISYDPARDETTYSSDSFYPSSLAELGSSGFIRDQRVLQLRFFPFQYNPVSGELRHYTRMRVEVRFSYPGGQPRLSAASTGDESFKEVLENGLLNYDSAQQWRTGSSVAALSGLTLLGQGEPRYKVLVDEDGIYQLTYTDLASAGMALGSVDSDDFELYNQGQEVAIHVVDEDEDGEFDEEDYILFYGQQMTSTYTYTNVYWLSAGTGDGLRMAEKDGTLGASTVLTYFNTTSRGEDDLKYYQRVPVPTTIPSEEELDHWFGGFVLAPGPSSTHDFVVTLDGLAIAAPPYSGTLRGALVARNSYDATGPYDHWVKVYFNGELVHEALWSGEAEYQFEETDIPHTNLVDGDNTVTVECLLSNPTVADWDFVYVNWFEIDYRRTYSAENDKLFFDGDEEGTWQYEVGEFLTSTIEVFDVTDPPSVTRFVSKTVEETGSYTVKFRDAIPDERHYLALTPSQYRSPADIIQDSPSDLRSTSNGADYIIVTHADFYTDVLPLRDHRSAQGLDVTVVDVQDIYDEFSFGIFDPHAIRDFIGHAYKYWIGPDPDVQHAPPSYVLLVGDGNYDFKDHLGRGEPNYIPPYLIYADIWMGETAADNRYVCVSGDDELPDMHIGRLPAQTVTQASTMINKTLDYETSLPVGGWRREVFFLADDPDTPGDPQTTNHFWSLSDDVADNHLPPAYTAEKVYYDVAPHTTLDAVKEAIEDSFDTGRLFINYVGHAGPLYWGGYPPGYFLEQADVATLPSGEGKMPIVITMSCSEGYFIDPNSPGSDSRSCIGETMVRTPGRGSVANWSAASLGLSSGQHYLHEGFYDAVFRDNVHQLGPATNLGKLYLYQNAGGDHRELIDTYTIFGDPALHMPIEHMVFMPLGLKGY